MTEEFTRSGYREPLSGFLNLGYEVGVQPFQYRVDSTCNSAVVPCRRAAFDGRGQRTFVSWLSEQYLERHGIARPGFLSASRG